jgi:hypothetical protein
MEKINVIKDTKNIADLLDSSQMSNAFVTTDKPTEELKEFEPHNQD